MNPCPCAKYRSARKAAILIHIEYDKPRNSANHFDFSRRLTFSRKGIGLIAQAIHK